MYGQNISWLNQFLRTLITGAVIFIVVVLPHSIGTASSHTFLPSSQEPQREIELVPPGQEKKLYIHVGPRIPLKFKVKNLNSKKWAHDLEVEVTNTSERPIYFFDFFISLPEIKGLTGNTYAFWLHYGRGKLLDFSTPLEKDDVPLLPGEKYTFKLSDGDAKGWDYMRQKHGKPEPTRILIEFQSINFGDGTGYDDVKLIDTRKKINFNKTCVPPPHGFPDISSLLTHSFLPASFLPVKFFMAETFEWPSTKILSVPDVCGCDSGCHYVKQTFYTCGRTCDPGNDEHRSQTSVACTDPTGGCRTIATRETTCFDPTSGLPLTCTDTVLFSCFPGAGFEGDGSTCTDGIDNDSDGARDCGEPACASDPTVCPPPDSCPQCPDADPTECPELCFGPVDFCANGASGCPTSPPGVQAAGCWCFKPSPIVLDVAGNGFNLTGGAGGVRFDITGDGAAEQIAWTSANSDDAWLVLDRNGNGAIDSGRELFGNFTPQPPSEHANGFVALAEYDKAANGGNGDRRIDSRDAIFGSLRLWQDLNHNGVSEMSELHSLSERGINMLDLDYKRSKRVDQHGNEFRYRGKIKNLRGAQLGRWAYDVFLVS